MAFSTLLFLVLTGLASSHQQLQQHHDQGIHNMVQKYYHYDHAEQLQGSRRSLRSYRHPNLAVIPKRAVGEPAATVGGIHSASGMENDLPAILLRQAVSNSITVFVSLGSAFGLLLNSIYSLIHFGGTSAYIVATVGDENLRLCQSHNLPCYNATSILMKRTGLASVASKDALFMSKDFVNLNWLKVYLLEEIMSLNYDIHFSDADLVYLRPVWPSYRALLSRTGADASFMREDVFVAEGQPKYPGVNVGNFVLLNNARTKALVQAWARNRDEKPGSWAAWEQGALNGLRPRTFQYCNSQASCSELQAKGIVAVVRHPSQAPDANNCPPSLLPERCSASNPVLYWHMICFTGRASKEGRLRQMGLWYLSGEDGNQQQKMKAAEHGAETGARSGSGSGFAPGRPIKHRRQFLRKRQLDIGSGAAGMQLGGRPDAARHLLMARAGDSTNTPVLQPQQQACPGLAWEGQVIE